MKTLGLSQKTSPTSLHQLMFVLQHSADELLDFHVGVGLSSVRIMSALDKSAPQSQRAIASQLKQTEANVSRQLKAMKKQGLVNVRLNKKDKRQREVVLTSKGSRSYDKACRLLNAQQKEFLKLLSANEHKAFEHAINNLLKAV